MCSNFKYAKLHLTKYREEIDNEHNELVYWKRNFKTNVPQTPQTEIFVLKLW